MSASYELSWACLTLKILVLASDASDYGVGAVRLIPQNGRGN